METTNLDLLLRSRRSHKAPAQRKCRFWWCPRFVYGAGDLCVSHLRNQQRKGNPLASRDAQALYTHIIDDLYPLLRKLVENAMYVNVQGDVVCAHCGAEADENGVIHEPGCPTEKASEILLRE